MAAPVLATDIATAQRFGLEHVPQAALACRAAKLPFYAACALLEKESGGRNVYGHDAGGVRPADNVTARNFLGFLVDVMNGETSNGVGPCQITYAGPVVNGHRNGGYFRIMAERELLPWNVYDNMLFGFGILAEHYALSKSWQTAGKAYNGAAEYGVDLDRKVGQWRNRFREAR